MRHEHLEPVQVVVEIREGALLYKLTMLEGEVVGEVAEWAPEVFAIAARKAAEQVLKEIEGGRDGELD